MTTHWRRRSHEGYTSCATLLILNVILLAVFFCQLGDNEKKIIAISKEIKKMNEKIDRIMRRLY